MPFQEMLVEVEADGTEAVQEDGATVVVAAVSPW